MSNPDEQHQGENPLMNLIHKTNELNQMNQDFNPNNKNNPLENSQNKTQNNMEPNYDELVSGLAKLGLDESSKLKIPSIKKQEQSNFFQNPMMNKNNQKDMAFNYFFGNNIQRSDLSKQLGFNPNIKDLNEENNEENEGEGEENNDKNNNEFNNINNNFISQENIMMQLNNKNENNNKQMVQMNNNMNNNVNLNLDPRIRNMLQQNMMQGNNLNNPNQQIMMNNLQISHNNNNTNNNMNNNPNKNRKKKNRGNKINNNNNVNIQNMNLIMNQQQLPYNYQYMQNQNVPYIPNQNQNSLNLNNINNINPIQNYIPNNRNMKRYNPPQQQVIMPQSQGESYPHMNMIGMNMNQNTITLDQFIARANNNFPGKFYVIKSLDESNILSSIRFKIWCSTIKGNQKLQKAYKEADKKYPIFLFFSVNGSGKFMGIALMNSDIEYKVNFNYWSQNDKWKGFFVVNWICIKDVPNRMFRNIINDLNENKPVTSSRDTQEICTNAGVKMLKIFRDYPQESTIFDSQNDMKFPLNQGDYGNNNSIMNMNINIGGNMNNNMNNQNFNYIPNKGKMRNIHNTSNMNNMNMNNINLNNINSMDFNNIRNNMIDNRNNMNFINNINNNNINNNNIIPNPNIPGPNIPNINIQNPNIPNLNIQGPNIPNISSMPNMINSNNKDNFNPLLKFNNNPPNFLEENNTNQNMIKDNNMENFMMKMGNLNGEKNEKFDLGDILPKKDDEEEEERENDK